MTSVRVIDLYAFASLGGWLPPGDVAEGLKALLEARRALRALRRPDGCWGYCRARETGAEHARECCAAAACLGEDIAPAETYRL